MPYATTDDGVRLYFEETGSGSPVILVHEFAGDLRSHELQMRHFGKRYRTIAVNARGFPPSDVPEHVSSYSQARAADDILAVLDHTGERQAHIVGLSMGGFATLHFGLRHPQRARSLCIGGCGYAFFLYQRVQSDEQIQIEAFESHGRTYDGNAIVPVGSRPRWRWPGVGVVPGDLAQPGSPRGRHAVRGLVLELSVTDSAPSRSVVPTVATGETCRCAWTAASGPSFRAEGRLRGRLWKCA